MNKQEKWATVIAGALLVASLVIVLPVIFPVMAKMLDSPLLASPANLAIEAQEVFMPIMYKGELDDLEDRAGNPEGVLYVTDPQANIRNYPEVADGNIIGETTSGNYLLYFLVEQHEDGSWYYIRQRDDLEEGWIGGSTVQEIASNVNNEENVERIEVFMDHYLKTAIKAIESYDFTIIEPFLLPTGAGYQESQNYLNHLRNEQIKEDLLAHRVIDAFTLSDGQMWVRTIEFYNITYSDGSMRKKDFISEYVLTAVGENEYKLNRLLGTYQKK